MLAAVVGAQSWYREIGADRLEEEDDKWEREKNEKENIVRKIKNIFIWRNRYTKRFEATLPPTFFEPYNLETKKLEYFTKGARAETKVFLGAAAQTNTHILPSLITRTVLGSGDHEAESRPLLAGPT